MKSRNTQKFSKLSAFALKALLATICTSLLATFSACTVEGEEDDSVPLEEFDNISSQKEFDASWEKLTSYEKEFEYNYELLDTYYLFAHSDSLEPKASQWYNRLKKRKAYIDMGYQTFVNQKEKYPSNILDIYYMYIMMNDKYTQYVDPISSSYEEVRNEMTAREQESDLGIMVRTVPDTAHLGSKDSTVIVTQILTGSAAMLSGKIQVNDYITFVNDIPISDAGTFQEISKWQLTQPLVLQCHRIQSGEVISFNDTLSTVPYIPPTVTYQVIDSVAIISISEFSNENTPHRDGTYGEFLEALAATKNTKATVIDMRGNPGGDGNQCEAIAKEMIYKGDIVSIEYYSDIKNGGIFIFADTIMAEKDGQASNRYLVFAVNSKSGSCSEYALAGVTSNRASPVVGQVTYGKGVGYNVYPTYLQGTAIITNVISYDKNHKTYHMVGIAPDIQEDNDDAILQKAIEVAKEGTMKRSAGYGSETTPSYQPFMKSHAGVTSIFPKLPTNKELGRYKFIDNKLQNSANRHNMMRADW